MMDEGFILRPSGRFDIDCYVDADFAGLWPFEDKMDPTCVKSQGQDSLFVSPIVPLFGQANYSQILR